jgi:hypothetical protein
MKQFFFSILCLGVFLGPASAQTPAGFPSKTSLEAYLPPALRAAFVRDGVLYRSVSSGDNYLYYPGSAVSSSLEELRPFLSRCYGVEALFFLSYPSVPLHSGPAEGSASASPFSEGQKQFLLRTYNLALNLNTLQGVEYYSNRRNRREVLFPRVFEIDRPGSRSPVSFAPVSAIPPVKTIRLFQEDASFGDMEYIVTFYYREPITAVTLKNDAPFNYGFIPLARPGEMNLHVEIIPVREGFLFYGICLIQGRGTLFAKTVTESLYQRIFALYNWYAGQLTGSR